MWFYCLLVRGSMNCVCLLCLCVCSDTNVGTVVTLGLNDCQRLQECGQFLTFLYQGPTTALAVIGVLLFVIGPAVFAGFIMVGILIPFQRTIARRVGAVRVLGILFIHDVSFVNALLGVPHENFNLLVELKFDIEL